MCSPAVLQPFVHPCSCDGWTFSPQRLRPLCQPVYRSREGVFGGAGQTPWSQVWLHFNLTTHDILLLGSMVQTLRTAGVFGVYFF